MNKTIKKSILFTLIFIIEKNILNAKISITLKEKMALALIMFFSPRAIDIFTDEPTAIIFETAKIIMTMGIIILTAAKAFSPI